MIRPGRMSQRHPSIANSNSAVARSKPHSKGGMNVSQAESPSDIPATTKASTSRYFESFSGVDIGSLGGRADRESFWFGNTDDRGTMTHFRRDVTQRSLSRPVGGCMFAY